MTPEERAQLKQMQEQIKKLTTFMEALQRFDRIPLATERAISRRLDLNAVPRVTTGSKGATSENVSVNEAGSGTYSVLGPPDAFYQVTDGDGNVGYVPKYN